ncbi:MAG TPA: hypothetical protein VF992_06140 [Thermoplasmata archaeon]
MAQDEDRQRRLQLITQIARERLKLNPDDADALFAIAAAQGTLGDARSGVQSLERLAKLDPNYPGLWMLKAKLHARLGESDFAQQSRLRAAEAGSDEARPSRSTSPCPMCESPVPAEATRCSTCGVEFEPTDALEDELDELGHAAIQEIVQEEFKDETKPSLLEAAPAPATSKPKPLGALPATQRAPPAAPGSGAYGPSAVGAGADRAEDSPEAQAAFRRRVQRVAKGAQDRLRRDERDADALFALAASEAILGGAAVAVTLLDRLEALDSNYPGLWDLKAKLYASLGDAQRWQEARKRADRDYAEAAARSPDGTPCAACGSPIPAGVEVCPSCARPVGKETDLAQELDTLVDSMLGKEVSTGALSAEVAPELWDELAALAAIEPASAEASGAIAPRREPSPGAESSATAVRRRRAGDRERPGAQGRLRRLFASSALARFGIPIAVAGAVLLVPLLLLTGGGPWGPGQDQNIARATPQINGLNLNPAYGDVVGGTQFSFTVTVAQNSYVVAKDVRPVISVTNLSAGTDVVLIASFDGVTYALTSPTMTQQGSTSYYDFGTSFQQSVAAGATGASAPTWYVQFHYAVSSLPASVISWNAQLVTG